MFLAAFPTTIGMLWLKKNKPLGIEKLFVFVRINIGTVERNSKFVEGSQKETKENRVCL